MIIQVHLIIDIRVIAKSEELLKLEEALIVHQLFTLGQYHSDQDNRVQNQDQTVNV